MSMGGEKTTAHSRPVNTILTFAFLAMVYYLGSIIYSAFLGPLAKFPGPIERKFSRVFAIRSMVLGNEAVDIPELHKKYGPIVRVAPDELSFSGGARAFQDVYGFRKQGQSKPYKDPEWYSIPINGHHSLLTADDANHSRQRKILSNAFSEKALKEQEPLLKQWAGLLKAKLLARALAGQDTDMLQYCARNRSSMSETLALMGFPQFLADNFSTFDIMGDLCFAESLFMLEGSEYSPWVAGKLTLTLRMDIVPCSLTSQTIFQGIKTFTLFRGAKKFSTLTRWLVDEVLFKNERVRHKQREHFDYSKDRVNRRLAHNPERPDLWTRILEKSQGPGGLLVQEHHSIAALFMLAGTETTATALSGTTYHLLQNPKMLAKLSREIRENFKTFDDLHLENLARNKYINAVLSEGLRMFPPVPTTLPRKVPRGGAVVCGELLPEGTTIGVNHMAVYRSETHFKHAYEFHPERWMGDPEFKDDHLDALENFSVGPRNCLGKNFAWHEMRLLLATVVMHFDLELCDESKTWTDQKVHTLWHKKPLMCKLTPVS